MNTKHFFFTGLLFLAFIILAADPISAQSQIKKTDNMNKFTLPALPYSADALAPVISEKTINLHHGKHLQAYINNLNNLIVGTPFENSDLITIVKNSTGPIFNNAAQALNHEIYFNSFSPNPSKPSGPLLTAIEKEWGSFDNFKTAFSAAANSLFGAGWAWLAKDSKGNLFILQESNAGNPITKGYTPLLGFDVWEHAYYVDYENRRPDHVNQLWSIIDWDTVGERY